METDRELLELAAKAAGVKVFSYVDSEFFGVGINTGELDVPLWNPLTDDGDALRLAVRLCIQIDPFPLETFVGWTFVQGSHRRGNEAREFHDGDEMAATRRAIVRAAAEIGRRMQ